MITGLDHVQVCAPAGCEDDARAFFGAFLGLPEIAKPAPLIANGGVWFGLPDGRQVHVGIEKTFAPATKAHPCLRCRDLDEVVTRASEFGVPFGIDTRLELRRVYLSDPWGNRWEIVEGQHLTTPSA